MSEKRIPPYPDGVQQKEELTTRTFQYVHPFNYENVVVDRQYNCGEFHGLEMNPINSYWPQTERHPADGIIIEEEGPIVRVVVIGSACTPPGYVTLECEPGAGFRRDDEVEQVMPVRFRVNGLWGMHLRVDQWIERVRPLAPFRHRRRRVVCTTLTVLCSESLDRNSCSSTMW